MIDRTLIVVSEPDPVAPGVADRWGTRPSTGEFVDGTPIRSLGPATGLLRRPGLHIHDDHLDRKLPPAWGIGRVRLIFPSVHRSESGTPCFTVHPLGNPGPSADVGGRAGHLVPAAARSMTSVLRDLSVAGAPIGLGATFEATHHGPSLEVPAFFAEIGFGNATGPSPEALDALAEVLGSVEEDPRDRVVVGVGGGHYVPHFTDLALRRRWAFGHLISRHALEAAGPGLVPAAHAATPGSEGVLYARVADAEDPRWSGTAPRLRESETPRREDRPP